MQRTTRVVQRVADYDNPRSIASRLRARRTVHLLRVLEEVHAAHGVVRVIDIGGTRNYWNALPKSAFDRFKVHVTLVNLPGADLPTNDERFTFIAGDGCDLNWVADGEFDIAHANSVLEHVGRWDRMEAFAHEVRRVANAYVVQTPYFWFPIEPHFMAPAFHWLPEPLRVGLLRRLPLGHGGRAESLEEAVRRVQSAHLVDATMFRSLFPDATLHFEKVAGVRKSLMGVRPPSL
jgi:hypothetical protein